MNQIIRSARPSYIPAKEILETGKVEHNGITYEYLVLKHEFGERNAGLRIFTVHNDGVIAISDTYPDLIRDLGLIHEISEYTGKSEGKDDHDCVKTLCEELQIAEDSGLPMVDYISFRLEFFQNLLAYYERSPETEESKLMIRKLRHSVAHLQSLS